MPRSVDTDSLTESSSSSTTPTSWSGTESYILPCPTAAHFTALAAVDGFLDRTISVLSKRPPEDRHSALERIVGADWDERLEVPLRDVQEIVDAYSSIMTDQSTIEEEIDEAYAASYPGHDTSTRSGPFGRDVRSQSPAEVYATTNDAADTLPSVLDMVGGLCDLLCGVQFKREALRELALVPALTAAEADGGLA